MNRKQLHSILLIISITYSGCVYAKYHDYASQNQNIAEETIKRLKGDTLLVVIPTFQEKERIFKSANPRTAPEKKKVNQRLLNLYAERQIEMESIIDAFEELYTFSEVVYLPDSLVKPFEAGRPDIVFTNSDYKPDPSIKLHNRTPIKLLKQFDQEWQIKIGTSMVPNPFPNYYLYRNGLFGFLGSEKYDQMYRRVVVVFQRRFEKFYQNPEGRVRL